jgi:hypothetical protein
VGPIACLLWPATSSYSSFVPSRQDDYLFDIVYFKRMPDSRAAAAFAPANSTTINFCAAHKN